MASSTTEYAVRRNPEMGPAGPSSPVPPSPSTPRSPNSVPGPCSSTWDPSTRPPHGPPAGVELDGETVVSVVPRLGYLHSLLREARRVPHWTRSCRSPTG